MKRIDGDAGVRLLECTHPAKQLWRVRWDVQKKEDNTASYMEEEFSHKPTDEEIKQLVVGWYNEQTQERILSGFEYEGLQVWLSQENQLNYKAAYDLAVLSSGTNLPVVFKFGSDDTPHYYSFNSVETLTDFYTKAMAHIQTTLAEGWKNKDTFDLNLYKV